MTAKAVENQLRRAVARRGWTLTRSRIRDPAAADYQLWTLADRGRVLLATRDLDDVARYLDADTTPADRPRVDGRAELVAIRAELQALVDRVSALIDP